MFLELAYLATGLILCVIGKRLLEKGITGGFAGEGEVASHKFRIVTSSPGLVFLIAGLVIIIFAVFTQAEFEEASRDGVASLADLAETVTTSVLAQSSAEEQFATNQFETSVHFAMQGNIPSAAAYLVRAIVINPQLLRRALASPELKPVVRDSNFEAIVRQRFELPIVLEVASEPIDTAIFGLLQVYISLRSLGDETTEDVSKQLSAVPIHPQLEPDDVTLGRLESLLLKNPRSLLTLFEDPQYEWLLRNERLIGSLRNQIGELISQTNVSNAQKRPE